MFIDDSIYWAYIESVDLFIQGFDYRTAYCFEGAL